MKRIIVALVAALATILSGRGEIIYVNGAAFPIGSQGVDFDGDGAIECGFSSGGMICTADIPSSACYWPFYVGSGAASQLIVAGSDASVLPLATGIASAPPSGANWSAPSSGANLVIYLSSPRNGTSEWVGPLAAAGAGYLGVRFQAADGLHYGWIRVRMQQPPVEFMPVVVDWAYETTPDKPILAGEKPVYFSASLAGVNEVPPNNSRHSGSGSFVLKNYVDGNELSYHLELDPFFQPASAGIFGPATPNMNARFLIANLGAYTISNYPWATLMPLDLRSQQPSPIVPLLPGVFLIYDGQITLSSNQVAELLAGQLYVNLKSAQFRQGELRGEILPTAPMPFSATLSGLKDMSRNPRNVSRHHGEGLFILSGNRLSHDLALDTNFSWTSIGIYGYPIPPLKPDSLIAPLDNLLGVLIPDGGIPGEPGFGGQILYPGQSDLTLTDRQVEQLKKGWLYINILTPRFPRGEISGRILPAE